MTQAQLSRTASTHYSFWIKISYKFVRRMFEECTLGSKMHYNWSRRKNVRQFFIIESLTNSCRDERGEKEKSKSAPRPTLHFFASVTAGIDVLLRTLGCLVLTLKCLSKYVANWWSWRDRQWVLVPLFQIMTLFKRGLTESAEVLLDLPVNFLVTRDAVWFWLVLWPLN